MLQTANAKPDELKIHSYDIDPDKTIDLIQVKISDKRVYGINLSSKGDGCLMQSDWPTKSGDSEIVSQDVPPGYHIIGLHCSIGLTDKYIRRLSFMLWKRPDN